MTGNAKLAGIPVLAAALWFGAHQTVENPRVERFVRYYRAAQTSDAPVNFWKRLVYSFLLSTAARDEPQAGLTAGSGTAAHGRSVHGGLSLPGPTM